MLIFANPLLTRRLALVSLGLGLMGLASVAAGLLFVNTGSPYGLCRFVLPFAAFSWLVALLALVLGGIGRKERSGRGGLLAGSTTIVLFFLFWANMGLPPCGESWPSGARAVIGDLRTINQAEITYASTYNVGYSPSLAALGPGTSSTPTATAAGLIDEVLARGTKSGYVFTYTPGPRDADGKIGSYTITAHPAEYGKTGDWEFFSDQTGVIRAVREDRPATTQDRPIDELEIE